jgi:HAE1 family hydrophobic/amphiphilic exporter-1
LSVVVLFLFLRDWWSTAIISLAIPVSILVGFAPLYLLDVSLNLMSLGGLALGIGMLVDNAVVVLESVQRHREDGLDRREAAVVGTSEVAAAVTASTLTTVGVFAPIAFVEGVAGELFGDLAVAVCSSLLASLAVGLTLVPMLAALEGTGGRSVATDGIVGLLAWREDEHLRAWARRLRAEALGPPLATWRAARLWWRERPRGSARSGAPDGRVRARDGVFVASVVVRLLLVPVVLGTAVLARFSWKLRGWVVRPFSAVTLGVAGAFQGRYERLARFYDRALDAALRRPGTVLGVAFVISVVSVGLGSQLGTELLPELHQRRFTVDLTLPVGTPLARTLRAVEDAERSLLALDHVESVYASVGYDPRVETRSDQGEHTAELRVTLDDHTSTRAEDRVMAEVRDALATIERSTVKVSRPALFSFRTPIEIVLYTWDLDLQQDVGTRVVDRLRSEPGLADVRSSLAEGHPEIRIVYDRHRLHRLGLDPATVAARVRDKVQGIEATRIQRGDERVALLVQLVEPDRASVRDLQELNVNPNLQPPIPLAAVADFEEAVGPSEIRRIDQQRAVVVTASLAGFDLGTADDRIASALAALELPASVTTEVAGQSSEMTESLASLRFALGARRVPRLRDHGEHVREPDRSVRDPVQRAARDRRARVRVVPRARIRSA